MLPKVVHFCFHGPLRLPTRAFPSSPRPLSPPPLLVDAAGECSWGDIENRRRGGLLAPLCG